MKNVTKKEKKVVKPAVTMISYSIKMTIPTGQFANIIPEIVVNAGSPEEAEAYIAPHMNKLWKEYFMCGERRPEPTVAKPVASVVEKPVVPVTPTTTPVPPPPASSVAFTKASQAITSCLGNDALDLITEQIKKSVKLTPEDKDKLMVLVLNKVKELNKK